MNATDFVGGTISSLIASALYELAEYYVRSGLPTPILLHRRELTSALRAMPFIYKDVDSEVAVDFVDIDIETLDPNRMTAADRPMSRVVAERRLQVRNKVLILGNAGIGKSTYVRHTILNIFAGNRPPFLFEQEAPIPFFVPLKAVDNYGASPILRYVLENSVYLRGRRGPARLLKLAAARRVILFLDGYDEIAVDLASERQTNFVRDELNVLLGKAPAGHLRSADVFSELYRTLADCRVWLTSRKEFYVQNPIDITRVFGSTAEPLDCIVFGLLGVGNARAQLVKNIFDKYRGRSAKYRELLNEELFLQQVDRAPNEELSRLSINPLFLTVMCYVYVHRVLDEENPYVQWSSEDAAALVVRCMDILLRDLDEDKARGLPPAQRVALVRRRNAFEDEKRAFLPFFAWIVLSDRRNVFDVAFVNARARAFFVRSDFANRDAIVRSIDRAPAGSDSIGSQLANQGVFVAVGRVGNVMRYDFAHQRFKEVLAAKYVASNLSVEEVYALIEREDLAEFVFVLAKQESIGAVVFKRLLNRAAESDRRGYFGRMASDVLRAARDPVAREAAAQFLTDAIRNRSEIRIMRQFISEAASSGEMLDVAEEAFLYGLRERRRDVFTIGAIVLQDHKPRRLVTLLDEHLETAWDVSEVSMDALALAYDSSPALVLQRLDRIRHSQRAFAEVAYVIATATSAIDDFTVAFRAALESLPVRDLAFLLATIGAVNPALFGSLARATQLPDQIEAVLLIVRFAHANEGIWSLVAALRRRVFVVTRQSLATAAFKPEEKRPTRGEVFVERVAGDSPKLPAGSKRTDAATVLAPAEVGDIAGAIKQESDARKEGRTPRRRELPFLIR